MTISNKPLKRLSDKEFAEDIKKYIRSSHDFYGAKIPELRVLAKRLHEEYDLKGFYKVFNKFWNSGYHGERSLAIYTLEMYKDEFDTGTWSFMKTKLKDIKSWDKVDSVSINILGEILVRTPSIEKEIISMSKSKNIWYKRMALMSSIALVKSGDIGLAINLCQENLYSEEENIQKAVGICLKEIGIQKPVVARGFILKNIKMPEKVFFIATENMKDIRKLRQTRKKGDFDFSRLMFWKEN